MPQRIQRKRTKGWRTPLCSCGCGKPARYVGRPTKWGNPFRLGTTYGLARVPAVEYDKPWEYEGRISADGTQHNYHHSDGRITFCTVRYMTAAEVVECYRAWMTGGGWPVGWAPLATWNYSDLRGHDLACWCPLEDSDGRRVPCHADVLLELANGGAA